MKNIQKLLRRFDAFQQRHKFFGFPIAVFKKYSDDNAGNQAALITYFGFVSLFPLLLVLFSVLRFITNHNNGIEERIVNATLHYFPVASTEIYNNIHGFHRSGLSFFLGILITLYGARGIASALQNASNNLWHIPKDRRPDFWHGTLRSFGIIILGGGGMIFTTVALSYANNISSKGPEFKTLVTIIALILNTLVFTVIFRFATVKEIKTKLLINGAIISAVFWLILQSLGSFLILHQLKRSSEFYGVFAIVLGMIFWIYIQAEVTLYSIEVNIVRTKKLWPRKIFEDS
jgi:membrane protein